MAGAWPCAGIAAPRGSGAESASFSRRARRIGTTVHLLALILLLPALAIAQVVEGTVSRVIDGDTLDVHLTSGLVRVRLHGVDAPERNQPMGRDATRALQALVRNKPVQLEPVSQDRYERMVAIVYVDGRNINAELVDQGLAWAARRYMRKNDRALCLREHEARSGKRGLWSLPVSQWVAPWDWRARRKTSRYTQETAELCLAAVGRRQG